MATHSSISCLENSMDRGAWWAIVHEVSKSWIQLSMHTSKADTQISGLSLLITYYINLSLVIETTNATNIKNYYIC